MFSRSFCWHRLAFCLALLGLLSAQCAWAQVALNFVNTDIAQVAKAIGAATGKTIIVDPRVKGQINLVSDQPVSSEIAMKTLEATLRMQGYALLTDHGVLKVVPEPDAKWQGVSTFIGNRPSARGDQVVTQVFQLHNASARNLMQVLRPLIPGSNTISAYPGSNALVVTDYADNIRRIAKIIQGIESGTTPQVEIVPLKNADALDLAQRLQRLLNYDSQNDPALNVVIGSDARTNSLILQAVDPARLKAARALTAQLDKPTAAPGNIHVITLKNANAVELAKTLRGMLGQGEGDGTGGAADQSSSSRGSGAGNALGQSSNSSLSSSNTLGGGSSMGGGASSSGMFGGLGSLGGGGNGGGAGAPPLPMAGSGNSSSAADAFGAGKGNASTLNATIGADPATNSLIVVCSEPVYKNLRTVIDSLDKRRAQIYIESLIIEVSSKKGAALGVQWQGLLGNGRNGVFGNSGFNSPSSNNGDNIGSLNQRINGTNTDQTGTPTGPGPVIPTVAEDVLLPLLSNGLSIGWLHRYGNHMTLGALLQAIDTDNDVNVLSTPNLITLDNEEARIMVGQNIPVVTGGTLQNIASGNGNTQTPWQSYERQDVGITLDVKPQITANGTIKLQIYQEDSGVVPGTENATQGPTLNKRSIESTILADNGQIIVLGGLIDNKYGSVQSKVPLLGDIPLLGALFRYENKSRDRTNLMVFLRPVILDDAQASAEVSDSRYNYMRSLSQNYRSPNWIVRDRDTPVVPPVPPTPGQGVPAQDGLFDLNRLQFGPSSTSAAPIVPGSIPLAPPRSPAIAPPVANPVFERSQH